MKLWIGRAVLLVSLLAAVPLAEGLQWLVSSLHEGDGEITSFAINHAVAALPTLVYFVGASLLLWWCRGFFSIAKLIMSVSLCIAAFGVLNFAAEILLATEVRPESDDKVYRFAYPYIQFKGTPASGGNNTLGYGGAVPELDKKEGEYRIIVLGGSTVRFGGPPIPALIEQMFRDEGFDEVRVFNFGVSGSNTGMELARLVFEIPRYKPDIVVSYSGGNDINLPMYMDPRPGYPYNFMVYENHPLYTDDYPVLALTAYGSHLFRLLGKGFFEQKFSQREQLQRSVGWNTESWREGIAQAYVRNLTMTATVAAAIDSEFVGFLQPMLLSKKTLSLQERTYLDGIAARVGLTAPDLIMHFVNVRDGIKSRLQVGERSTGIRFEDLTTAYDSTEMTIFPDFIHTGQQARLLVARKIFEHLRNVHSGQS